MTTTMNEVAVVGGGLAGLSAATLLARAGRKVRLFEKSHALGGRAITTRKAGFSFNLGAHALYLGGRAQEVLDGLGVPYAGAAPAETGRFFYDGGRLHLFPASVGSMLRSTALSLGGRLELARLYPKLMGEPLAPLRGLSLAQYLDRRVRRPEVRRLVEAVFRVSTFTNAPALQDVEYALTNVRAGVRGVLYLHGGWQSLVDGLRAAAERAGVAFETQARVDAVLQEGNAVSGIQLADGTQRAAAQVLLAVSPTIAATLAPRSATVARAAAQAVPAQAACLDVALTRLPVPANTFALGGDLPLYLSVHSATASLAPEGGALIHLLRYLTPEAPDAEVTAAEGELETLLDQVQPGWRAHVVERRFVPRLIANAAIRQVNQPWPDVAVPDTHGLYLAGDWVGPHAMLTDSALGSARDAAERILAEPTTGVEAAPHLLHAVPSPRVATA